MFRMAKIIILYMLLSPVAFAGFYGHPGFGRPYVRPFVPALPYVPVPVQPRYVVRPQYMVILRQRLITIMATAIIMVAGVSVPMFIPATISMVGRGWGHGGHHR